MGKNNFTRRQFIAAGSMAAMATTTIPSLGSITHSVNNSGKLALLGGDPVVKNKVWPAWPYVDEKMVEAIVKTTRSGIWCRIQSPSGTVPTFESEYSKM